MLTTEAFLDPEGKLAYRLKEERTVDFTLKVPLAFDAGTVLRIPNEYNNFSRIALVKEVFFDLEGKITFSYNDKGSKGEEELGFSKPQYTLISQPGSYFDYKSEGDFDEVAVVEQLTASSEIVRQRAFLKSIALRCLRRVFPGEGVPICPGTCLDVMDSELEKPGIEVLSVDPKDIICYPSSPLFGLRPPNAPIYYMEVLEKWIDRLVEGDEEAIKYRDQIEVFLH
jgi:hypothetical protein